MLTQIHIQNFVIVEKMTLEFNNGLSVLTGETGAGKSIWVDAVLLALGSRADGPIVRENCPQCEIILSFDISSLPQAQQWLNNNEMQEGDDCLIRRVIKADGKTSSYLNGRPTSLHVIRELAPHLILIHSQHHQQLLLKKTYQREQLDQFCEMTPLVEECFNAYQQWRSIHNEIQDTESQHHDHEQELQYLQYQLTELQQLNLEPNTWNDLSKEHSKCHNAKDFIHHVSQALDATSTDPEYSADHFIQTAIHHLNQVQCDEEKMQSIRELLNTANIHIQEATSDLKHYRDSLDLSPERLAELEHSLEQIHDCARKHRIAPEDLLDIIPSLEQKIHAIENHDEHLLALKQTEKTLVEKHQKISRKISQKRKQGAKILNKKVTECMQQLNFSGGAFNIQLQAINQPIQPYGQESVEFHITTNTGQTPQPMTKVVSGGELSRINLALQVITAESCTPPTLIFDEVDSGIGGQTAQVVGEYLNDLGQHSQVLCITHLPQIAVHGQHHYQIEKHTQDQQTLSEVKKLTQNERVKEIARMLGGNSRASQTHAKEMLTLA